MERGSPAAMKSLLDTVVEESDKHALRALEEGKNVVVTLSSRVRHTGYRVFSVPILLAAEVAMSVAETLGKLAFMDVAAPTWTIPDGYGQVEELEDGSERCVSMPSLPIDEIRDVLQHGVVTAIFKSKEKVLRKAGALGTVPRRVTAPWGVWVLLRRAHNSETFPTHPRSKTPDASSGTEE